MGEETEIDLHGVKHQDVNKIINSFIWEHMKKKSTEIKIITGNSETMKNLVREILMDYEFLVEDSFFNSATLIVKLK